MTGILGGACTGRALTVPQPTTRDGLVSCLNRAGSLLTSSASVCHVSMSGEPVPCKRREILHIRLLVVAS